MPEKGVALITGASAGIGAAYAAILAARGYDLVLVARDHVRLEAASAALRGSTDVAVEVLPADLTRPADLRRVERRLLRDDISVLVNNAGIAVPGRLVDMPPDRLEAMLLLNVLASTRLARAVAPGFVARGRGDIINVGSVVGLNADRPGISAVYTASKAYLLALSEGLQNELGRAGVRVQAVLPGMTRTEIWEKANIDIDALAADRLMGAEVMVEAALRGLDLGERVTIPSLPDIADWLSFMAAREALRPNLSRSEAADRYGD
ncbi:MAG: SDR family NAD(P)-dependent oxidoreductase [Caulobacter sp.]|nr:SDR family NAD(P)-dependent oxidoreductase [Caulobacter sp.]